jgi:Mce-associated membrane protein
VTTVTTRTRVAAGLAVLVLAAAVALVWLVQRSGAGDPAEVTTAESAAAVVASAAVKATVRDAAAEAVTRAYSYSWQTLAEDKADARDLMTERMARQYDRTMAGVATTSRRDRTEVSATVAGTALVTATAAEARVLVFVNQSTTRDDLDKPLLNLDRVLVTLVRVGGAWKVSELDAL